LYDSYIRAIRWASDRIKERGIVCFVTNGSFIDNNAMDGLRKCLADEFTSVYCFNLRGNQRTSGETSRKEGGKIFGSGSRAPIAITLLIKNPEKAGQYQLFYHDIGDYLSREEKLDKIKKFGSFKNIPRTPIKLNDSHDWISQRNAEFEKFISLGDKSGKSSKTIFDNYSRGIATSRDAWTYNFSRQNLASNMTRMIDFYNSQVEDFQIYSQGKTFANAEARQKQVESFISTDPASISWSVSLKNDLSKFNTHKLDSESIFIGMYRPYCKQWSYFNKEFNDRRYQMPKIFPNQNLENLVISVTGLGVTKDFNAFITNCLPDVQLQANGQCFPLYTYEKNEATAQTSLFTIETGYTKKENISDDILKDFQTTYQDQTITKEAIFYYVYGVLHSPEYKKRFAADLKKMLPRIPYCADFWAFSKAGKELAQWHLNYETVEPYPLDEFKSEIYLEPQDYTVERMKFPNRDKKVDKTTIIYNSKITLSGIPLQAYEYIVNGKSAIEWIIDRYQIRKDEDSGITNNPNHWSDDPHYIIDLVKRIVRVSIETVKIVESLPELNER
ncbi:MAG: type ISP restriction/modification enzyme, partial [Pseudanabaenaceae cyanobacterium]